VRNSMQHLATYCLVAASAVSFFAVGVPYWQIPYAKLSLPAPYMARIWPGSACGWRFSSCRPRIL
jgi:hypothetical protein